MKFFVLQGGIKWLNFILRKEGFVKGILKSFKRNLNEDDNGKKFGTFLKFQRQ